MSRKILEKLLDEMPVKDFQSVLWLAQNIDLVVDYLIDNGGIFPPCKIGTILYNIIDEVEEIPVVDEVEEIHVFGFDIDKDDHYLMVERWGENINEIMFNNDYWLISFNEFGKTVFTTREAAKQALKERNDENSV